MVSSGLGSFHKLMGDRPAYRVSKTALNALTVIPGRRVARCQHPGQRDDPPPVG